MNSLTIAERGILKQLDTKISNQSEIESLRTMTQFYVKISLSSVHLYHPLGAAATIGQYVDKRVVEKLFELVQNSTTNLGEVKQCLDQFVESELFCVIPDFKKPRKTNQRYYPRQFPLKSTQMMPKSLSATRLMIGENNLPSRNTSTGQETIHAGYETDSPSEDKSFLFVHQEP